MDDKCLECEHVDDCHFSNGDTFFDGTLYAENDNGDYEPIASVENGIWYNADGYAIEPFSAFEYDDKKENDNMADKSFGMNFNSSVAVDESGKASVGVHYSDSNGLDFSRDAKGDDVIKTYTTLLDGLIKEVSFKKNAKMLEEKKARDAKRSDLQKQIDDLQKQLDALDKVEARSKDSLADTFADFDKELDDFKNRYKNFFEAWPF